MNRKKRIILSVHLPKTAGTSFKSIITSSIQKYPNISLDIKSDAPLHISKYERTGIINSKSEISIEENISTKIIHGHFFPSQYNYLFKIPNIEVKVLIWLRHPLERMISHYNYWSQNTSNNSRRLHKLFVTEEWSFDDFAFHPNLKNVYSSILEQFDLENISFVGNFRIFDDEINRLNNLDIFPIQLVNHKKKLNQTKIDNQSLKVTKRNFDHVGFKEFHRKDYDLYSKLVR